MKFLPRKRALVLLLLALIATQSFLSFDWLTVSMAPEGKVTVLGTLAGSALFPAAQSLLMLGWITFALLAIARGRLMLVFAAILAATFALELWFGGTGLIQRDWHAQQAQLTTWQSIAAAHDITDLTIQTGINGWLFLSAGALGLLTATASVIAAGSWARVRPANSAVSRAETAQSAPDAATVVDADPDSISLWESQRAK